MNAIIFDQVGDPRQVLQLRDMPIPKPPPGHVRVRMLASPINPSDLIYITGTYGLKPELPATPVKSSVAQLIKTGAAA